DVADLTEVVPILVMWALHAHADMVQQLFDLRYHPSRPLKVSNQLSHLNQEVYSLNFAQKFVVSFAWFAFVTTLQFSQFPGRI
ncbi:hypothetical protein, partial [Vibrio vulnificus]|uniref:hypothetical protein n=1 Tax=Vibrio vulnificus TaxID=672 RepID=UPI0019D4DB1E